MKLIKIILAMAGLVATPIVTIAGEDSQLTINEEPFVTSVAAPAHLENVDTIYSGDATNNTPIALSRFPSTTSPDLLSLGLSSDDDSNCCCCFQTQFSD